jgi:hypothetical protein
MWASLAVARLRGERPNEDLVFFFRIYEATIPQAEREQARSIERNFRSQYAEVRNLESCLGLLDHCDKQTPPYPNLINRENIREDIRAYGELASPSGSHGRARYI